MIHRFASCALVLLFALAPCIAPAQTAATNASPGAPAPAPAATTVTTSGANTPQVPATTAERPSTYTIEQGDTLWSISKKFDTSIKALQKENGLKKHALLHIGQVIKIPAAK